MIVKPDDLDYSQQQYYNLQPMNLLSSLHRRPLVDLETLLRALGDIYFTHKFMSTCHTKTVSAKDCRISTTNPYERISAGFILKNLDKCPNLLEWESVCLNNIYNDDYNRIFG